MKKRYKHYEHEEHQYLQLMYNIIYQGYKSNDRTGTGTLSLFGKQMRFSLRDGKIPLITTKKCYWDGIVKELLWFISGNTSSLTLEKQKVNIWKHNGSREFLDYRGLEDNPIGDLGPIYGFQWRHYGTEYKGVEGSGVTDVVDYTDKGIDQLKDLIHTIKTCPNSRRMILTAWNPMDLRLMALPPCHMTAQFYVSNGELSCQLYQRSADMGLGVPFNIASYALLTHLIAKCCGLKAGEFIHTLGNAHIYLNHIDAVKEQIKRTPYEFPNIKINADKNDIDDFKFEDIELVNYKCHDKIKMKMSV